MTTIEILLSLLIKELELTNEKEKYILKIQNGLSYFRFGYVENKNSFDCLKEIFGENIINKEQKDNIYTENLKTAKEFFEDKLKDKDENFKKELFEKITEKLLFNIHEIEKNNESVIFETMNNRGKPLSTLELLKNRIIYLSEKTDKPEYVRNTTNEIFKKLYGVFGEIKVKDKDGNIINKDDNFLNTHWKMYFDEYSNKPFDKFLLDQYFKINNKKIYKNNKIDSEILINYLNDLGKNIESYKILQTLENNSLDDKILFHLERLKRIDYVLCLEPLLIAILTKINELDKDEVIEFLDLTEKYIFLVFVMTETKPNYADSTFYKYASEFYFSDYVKNKNKNKIKLDNIKNKIIEIIQEKYKIDYFILRIEKYFNTDKHQCGYTKWKDRNYFLSEYEKYLNKNLSYKELTIDLKNPSLEHILPKDSNIHEKGEWKNVLKEIDRENHKYLKHSLGNLVLLSTSSKNSSLGNKDFIEKKKNTKQAH